MARSHSFPFIELALRYEHRSNLAELLIILTPICHDHNLSVQTASCI